MFGVGLTDLERKVITIIQNNNTRGHSPSLVEISIRSVHEETEIKPIIEKLIQLEWIELKNGGYRIKKRIY